MNTCYIFHPNSNFICGVFSISFYRCNGPPKRRDGQIWQPHKVSCAYCSSSSHPTLKRQQTLCAEDLRLKEEKEARERFQEILSFCSVVSEKNSFTLQKELVYIISLPKMMSCYATAICSFGAKWVHLNTCWNSLGNK